MGESIGDKTLSGTLSLRISNWTFSCYPYDDPSAVFQLPALLRKLTINSREDDMWQSNFGNPHEEGVEGVAKIASIFLSVHLSA